MKLYEYLGKMIIVVIISLAIQTNLLLANKYGTDLVSLCIYSLPANAILVWLIVGKIK